MKTNITPNECGVYPKEHADCIFMPTKDPRKSRAEVYYMCLEPGKWISAINFNYSTGGTGDPLTANQYYLSERDAVLGGLCDIIKAVKSHEAIEDGADKTACRKALIWANDQIDKIDLIIAKEKKTYADRLAAWMEKKHVAKPAPLPVERREQTCFAF